MAPYVSCAAKKVLSDKLVYDVATSSRGHTIKWPHHHMATPSPAGDVCLIADILYFVTKTLHNFPDNFIIYINACKYIYVYISYTLYIIAVENLQSTKYLL